MKVALLLSILIVAPAVYAAPCENKSFALPNATITMAQSVAAGAFTAQGGRGVHEMTVDAKALIGSYYGSGPKYSYWNGCSTGGRQALMEAQRYPTDYDGILAGAPAIYASHLQGMQVWASQTVHKDEASYI